MVRAGAGTLLWEKERGRELLQAVLIHSVKSLKITFYSLALISQCIQLKRGTRGGAIAQFPGMFHQKQACLSPSDIHILAMDFFVFSVKNKSQ